MKKVYKAKNKRKSVAVLSALLSIMLTAVSGFVNFAYRLNFDGIKAEMCAVFSLLTVTFYITTAVLAISERRRGVIIFGLAFFGISVVGSLFYIRQMISGMPLDTLPYGVAFTRIIYALLTLPITAYNAIIEMTPVYGLRSALAVLPAAVLLTIYIAAAVSVFKRKSEE